MNITNNVNGLALFLLEECRWRIFFKLYEPQSEKMYLSPKNGFFQKSDHINLNCHLAKFDSDVMMVNG